MDMLPARPREPQYQVVGTMLSDTVLPSDHVKPVVPQSNLFWEEWVADENERAFDPTQNFNVSRAVRTSAEAENSSTKLP